MAPPEETEAAAAIEEDNLVVKPGGNRPISTILIVIAMQTEALPLVAKFELSEDSDRSVFTKGVPWVRYHGTYKGLHINLVWPGKDTVLDRYDKPNYSQASEGERNHASYPRNFTVIERGEIPISNLANENTHSRLIPLEGCSFSEAVFFSASNTNSTDPKPAAAF